MDPADPSLDEADAFAEEFIKSSSNGSPRLP